MTLGEKIQKLRESKGISQEQLAEQINVSSEAVSQWESGEAEPDIDNLLPLSKTLGVSTDYLLKDINDTENNEALTALLEGINKSNDAAANEENIENNAPVFLYTAEMIEHYNLKARLICGGIITLLGVGGVLLFLILAIVNPVIYSDATIDSSTNDAITYTGLRAYLLAYNATGLFVFCCIIGVIGLATILFSDLKGFKWNDERLKPPVEETFGENFEEAFEEVFKEMENINAMAESEQY